MGDKEKIDVNLTGYFRVEENGISIDGINLDIILKRMHGRQVEITLFAKEGK